MVLMAASDLTGSHLGVRIQISSGNPLPYQDAVTGILDQVTNYRQVLDRGFAIRTRLQITSLGTRVEIDLPGPKEVDLDLDL